MYTVWQHLILLTLRQYERKSYRRFEQFLQEAFGVVEQLGLSKIPHYTTLQKAAARLKHGMLLKILESFVMHVGIRKMLAGIDSTGLSHGQASYYYTKRAKLRRKFVKISICADMRRQLVCSIKIRHRRRHDSMDFVPLLEQAVRLVPVGTVVADRGYDSEQNHVSAEKMGIVHTIIRPKYENLQIHKTKGFHRKNMKRHFDWETYHQRSKVETIFSVIKRMLGEYIMSRYILTQNRETMYRIMAYNCYRINRNCLLILDGFYRANRAINRIYDAGMSDTEYSIEIDTIFLDDYFKDHNMKIDFAKIDVEGSESGVVEGMSSILKRSKNLKIMTEFDPFLMKKFGVDAANYIQLLLENGFKLYDILKEEGKFIPITSSEPFRTTTPKEGNYTYLFCIKE